jgi:transposase InsO family protein
VTITEFVGYTRVLHRLTADFVRAVPDDKWDFTPDPPGKSGRAPAPNRIGDGFGPFCKQLRHVVCVRGVYNDALATRRVDWTRKHEHYDGPLTRDALLAALDQKQRQLLAVLDDIDPGMTIDWNGTPFNFALFTWEFVQHEAIHHGQWSLYASLAGFDTPPSWRTSWGL